MKPTICLNCENCLNRSKNKYDPIWYDLYCKASPLPRVMDYTTGKMENADFRLYENCRDINTDGKCPKYKEK